MSSSTEIPVTTSFVQSAAKILIVEDSITFQVLHERYLSASGYDVTCVGSGEEALQTLEINHFDIILMDVTMAGLDGFETAELIREQYAARWIPIIFIAGNDDDEHFHKAIESGGDDYLIKPVREAALISKVRAICRILKMQDGLESEKKQIEYQSRTDVLTGLFNRRAVLDEANTQWQLLTRLRHPMAVLLIDIDFFKRYNDHYGHQGGDICLQHVAKVLSQSFSRESDIVGRLGGEEFLVVLPNTTSAEASVLAQKMQKRLAQQALEHVESETGYVTVSVGCAACYALQEHCLDDLVKHADDLLYQAKGNGRNYVAWDDYPTSHQLLEEQEVDTPVSTLGHTDQISPEEDPENSGVTLPVLWVAGVVIVTALVAIGWMVFNASSRDSDTALVPSLVDETTSLGTQQPSVVADSTVDDSDALLRETRELLEASRALLPEPVVDVADDSHEPMTDNAIIEAIQARVEAWRLDWQQQDQRFFDHYHPDFKSSAGTPLAQWQAWRWPRIVTPAFIMVELSDLHIDVDDTQAEVRFVQRYSSDTLSDQGRKTLIMRYVAQESAWLIIAETFSVL